MIKKLIIPTLLFSSLAFADQKWDNDTYSEKNSFSYSASIFSDDMDRLEYKCSVLKLNEANFGKIDYINIDLDLKLEEDKLKFQENYNVNMIFSNKKEFKNNLPLKAGFNDLERFTFYLNSNKRNSDDIVKNLLYQNYVDIEVVDDNNKRLLYRFYLKSSLNAITKAENNCTILYKTFN